MASSAIHNTSTTASDPLGWQLAPARTTWTLDQLAAVGLVFCVVFVNGADFRGDTGETFSVHWQIYLRLAVSFTCGLVGMLCLFPRTWREFVSWPGTLLTAYCALYALTLPTSIDRSYSAAAWVSLLGVVLFIPAAMRILGGAAMLLAVGFALATHLLGSWFTYWFIPEIGVFHEQVTQTDVYERMGGLAHPNELGFYATYTALVFAGLGVAKRIGPWLSLAGVALGMVTIVGCFSRTAAIVCFLGLFATYQRHLFSRGNAAGLMLAGILVAGSAFLAVGSGQFDWFIDELLLKVTKSGNTDELATATGRTEIWAYAVKMIQQSPLFGYGYCTARFVMEDYSYHGHNVILNAMLFGGVLSGLVVACMMGYFAWSLVAAPRPEIDGLVVAMLAGGMVDGILGAPSPSGFTLIWMMTLLWRQMEMSTD